MGGDSRRGFDRGGCRRDRRPFWNARRQAEGLGEYPGDVPPPLEEAYRIQDAAIARWAKPVLGWKVGRVPPPHSERFGTDRLAGPIFAVVEDGNRRSLAAMPVFARGFAAGEAEYLLRIGSTPPKDKLDFTLDEAAALVDAVHVGIEIASSPLRTINELGPVAVISDFGNNNGLLVGDAVANWRRGGSRAGRSPLGRRRRGRGGHAAAFPDGPIGAARFLFELMARRGIPLIQDSGFRAARLREFMTRSRARQSRPGSAMNTISPATWLRRRESNGVRIQ